MFVANTLGIRANKYSYEHVNNVLQTKIAILGTNDRSSYYHWFIGSDLFEAASTLGVSASSTEPTIRLAPDGSTSHLGSTTISRGNDSVTVSWWVTRSPYNLTYSGIIQLNFDDENIDFGDVVRLGGTLQLAEEMHRITRGLNPDYLSLRTVSGLEFDLIAHWAGSEIHHMDPFVASMGGIRPSKPGFDGNAFVFEGFNAAIWWPGLPKFSPLSVDRFLRDVRGELFH